MDNFDFKKYLAEGKLLKEEEYTYNEFVKDNLGKKYVKTEEKGIKLALKLLGVKSGDDIRELTNTMDSTNTALYLNNAKENGELTKLPIKSEYFEKAYLGKWKNGEPMLAFDDGFDYFVYVKKELNESAPGYDTRKFGESLPTMESVKAAYEAKKDEKVEEVSSLEEGMEYDIDAMEALGFDLYPGGRSEAFKHATEDLGIPVDEILGKMDDDMVYNAIHHSLQILGMYSIDEAKKEEDEM